MLLEKVSKPGNELSISIHDGAYRLAAAGNVLVVGPTEVLQAKISPRLPLRRRSFS